MPYDTTRIHKTLFQKSVSQDVHDAGRNVTEVHHQRADSEPGVDIIGIYVEHHEGLNREFVVWIQFDF